LKRFLELVEGDPDFRARVLDEGLCVRAERVEPGGLRGDEFLQRRLDVGAEPSRVPTSVLRSHPASVDPYRQGHV